MPFSGLTTRTDGFFAISVILGYFGIPGHVGILGHFGILG